MSDPYPLSQTSDDLPPRLRVIPETSEQGYEPPQPYQREQPSYDLPPIKQTAGSPYLDTGPQQQYFPMAEIQKDPVATQPDSSPFTPVLGKTGTVYKAGLTPGIVNEKVTNHDDVEEVNEWVPEGLTEDGEMAMYALSIGQSIYVAVHQTDAGRIGGDDDEPKAVQVMVGAADLEPVQYESGAVTYYYQMARLVAIEGGAALERLCGGSNIDHATELGRNLNFAVYRTVINFAESSVTRTLAYTLCWRNARYAGKFASTATLPPAIGTTDNAGCDNFGGHGEV